MSRSSLTTIETRTGNPADGGVVVTSAGRRFVGAAVVATTVLGLAFGTAGQAAARICMDPSGGRPVPCPTGSGHEYAPPIQPVTDSSDWTRQWLLLAAAVLAGLAIVAVMADVLARRRWRQPALETALASSDPADLSRAAGLLGERFVEHNHVDAAEHAYRAAIDAGDEYWIPIAQVALAELLTERGERIEARTLLDAAIASGHPRAIAAAQSRLDRLATGTSHTTTAGTDTRWQTYERLEDAPTNR